jgi:ABC-type antimicrobial peptide transport system permease subunit
VTTVARQLEQAYPDTNEKRGIEVSPLASEVFGQIRPAISLLFGAVGFVLVIACASVASLLLARTQSRRREFSLRRAIGANELRLVRLMLAESAWVVLLGGAAGTLLAMWAGDALLALSPVQLPSFAALARFDPGFDPSGVLSMRVQLPVVAGAQAGARFAENK